MAILLLYQRIELMKHIYLAFILMTTLAFSQNMPARTSKKVVFIIVDGISYDQLQTAKTPHLDRIAKEGSFTEAYVGGIAEDYRNTPTISAVGYNSLLTGTWANKHNVYGNGIKKPNYSYPTIFRLYKDQHPNGSIAVFSSWLDNRTKLVGDGLPETKYLKVNEHYDGMEHDSINFPHDKQRNFMKMIDMHVALKASEVIENKGPDVSWVYLEFTDDMGHAFGDSPRFNAAVTFEDGLIGRIYNAVQKRQQTHNEDWLFVVTTDHGRRASDGKHHGGQTARERSTWIAINKKETNTYFKKQIPAIVDIYPTMLQHLSLTPSKAVLRELDGVSLLRPVDAIQLSATKKANKLEIRWKALQSGKANLYLTTTNHFNQSKTDTYIKIGEVDLSKEYFKTSVKRTPSNFYKVVLETPNTTLNYWITK